MTTFQRNLLGAQYLQVAYDYPLSGSSVLAIAADMEEIRIRLFNELSRSKRSIDYFSPPFPAGNFDISSIAPNIEIRDETYPAERIIPEDVFEHEHDIVFRMPPKKTYKIRIKVGNVTRGRFRFVEPE